MNILAVVAQHALVVRHKVKVVFRRDEVRPAKAFEKLLRVVARALVHENHVIDDRRPNLLGKLRLGEECLRDDVKRLLGPWHRRREKGREG